MENETVFAMSFARAKRKNQILFSKDSLLLAELSRLIEQTNRREI